MRRSDLFIASQDDIDANKEEAMDTNTVIVNIENNSSAQVEAEDQGTNAAGDREMKLFISNTIAEDFSRGGNASRSAVQSFGLRPKTI